MSVTPINARMVEALEMAKQACTDIGLNCEECPCHTGLGCGFSIGFDNVPEGWKLEKTYKEFITEVEF